MAVFAVLASPARVAAFLVRPLDSAASRWRRCFNLKIRRAHSSDSPVDGLSHGLERYRELQTYFKRKLTATYRRFLSTRDCSAVLGVHHVYFIERDGIYRTHRGQSETEQVLNVGGDEGKRWTVQRVRLSPGEKHLAITLKAVDEDLLRCVIVRLGRRNRRPPDPPRVVLALDNVFSFEWATDNALFYTTMEGLRCSRAYRLDVTSGGSTRTCVHEETRPDVFVEVALSRDKKMLTINCSSRSSSEVLLVDVTAPGLRPVLVQRRRPELLYHAEHWRRRLVMLANTGPGREYQVVRAPLSAPSTSSWETVFAPGPGTVLKDMDVVGDHCVLVARTPADTPELIAVPLTRPEDAYTLKLPSWACAVETKNPDPSALNHVFEFSASSPVHPPTAFRLDPREGLLSSEAPPEENRGTCITTRLEARSKDGTSVPVTLFHAAPAECLRRAPLLAHVYGAYGRDVGMAFSPARRLLLERGWVLAFCHIRGGGERGLTWHRQARAEGKPRGVEDLRACLRHLFSSGVSSPSLAALAACSAGAVPAAALCNTHPHLMRAVALQAPFLDVLGTMEDPRLPLTLEDREEWGDPVGNPHHREAIASYCPLHNITPQRYPSMLLTARSGDTRAPLAGVLKYAAQLREAVHTHSSSKPGCEPAPNVALMIRPGTEHPAAPTTDEEALQLAFLHAELGLDPPRRAVHSKMTKARAKKGLRHPNL